MAELNPLGSFLSGMQASQQVRQARQQREDQQLVRGLAPQVIAGDTQAFDQVAAVNPEAAQSYQQVGDGQVRRLQGAINFITQAQKSNNPQAVEAAYQQVRPYLARFGQEPPATFSEAQPQFEQAKARIAMLGGAARSDVKVVGNALVDSNGNEVYRAREDARVVDINVPGGKQQVLYDPQTRQLSNLDGSAYFSGGNPELQAQMVNGQQIMVDPSLSPELQELARQDAASGGQMIQAVLPDRNVSAQQFNAPASTPVGFSPTAPAINAYQQAQLQQGDQRLQLAQEASRRADQAAQDASAVRQQQAQSQQQASAQKAQEAQRAIDVRTAQLGDVRRGVDRVKNAVARLNSSTIGTGPIAGRAQAYTEAGQELEAAVGAMNNSMLALTRVPGMGAQSDLEARIAGLRFPQLNLDERVNQRTLNDLEKFVSDLSGTAQRADQQDRQSLRNSSMVVDGPSQQTSRQAPPVGTVQRGYIFRGGDPANPSSWERQ
jgi:hypothetical protein